MINRRYGSPTAAIILCLLASIACGTSLAAEPKRVLLLHPSSGANLLSATKIRAELDHRSAEPLEVYDASLVTGRPVDEIVADRYGDYLRSIFPDQQLDLAIVVGGASLRLYQRYRTQLFPSTPLLAIAEERRFQPSAFAGNETTITTTIDFGGVIKNILQVLPETANVAVVMGKSPIEQYWAEQIRVGFQPYESRLSFTWLNDLQFQEMLNRAGTLPPRSAIYFGFILADASNIAREEGNFFSTLHRVANAPIFSDRDGYFGSGIVGGPLISTDERSVIAASAALRILRGEAPADIKIPSIGFSTPKFDWREMQRWGISEHRLPPGSEIRFRPPGIWQQYSQQILVGATALILQAAMICWLIYEHRRRNLAEVLARNSISELTHMNRVATVGEFAASIAHEVNQPLTGIVTRASAARRWLARESPDIDKARNALDQIEAAGHRASDIIKNVRAMFRKDVVQGKSPVDINQLIWTVLGLVYIDLRKHQIDLQSALEDQLPSVLGNEVQLQQVILNLMMNAIDAMRSVEPRVLSVKSKLNGRHAVQVSIEDTGIGIDPVNVKQIFNALFTTKPNGMGMGLSICRSIIESHDGRIWVSPGVTGGSIFQFELPTEFDKDKVSPMIS
jgi:signal transduction histidine kinase